jgi:hypothetical protein
VTTNVQAETYTVTIDYDQPFAEMITAGDYDDVNSFITEASFPVRESGLVETRLVLVHLERKASTDEVLRELAAPGQRLGQIAELLAFGALQPEKQRIFPIVALGAIETPYRRRPFLWGSARVRHLDLRFDEKTWSRNIRFLVVRE